MTDDLNLEARLEKRLEAMRNETSAHFIELRDFIVFNIGQVRKEMQAGFARTDAHLARTDAEAMGLRKDMTAGFARTDAELVGLRKDMTAGFARTDADLGGLRKDMTAGFARTDADLTGLRKDLTAGFSRLESRLARSAVARARSRRAKRRG